MFDTTCNSTLEKLIIEPGSERLLLGPLTFHDLALIVGGSCTIIAICLSLYLAFMHAINYTKPDEQRHIIRILFMIPVYSTSSFLQIYFYRHAIYFQLMSDCYEAFTIASFFALMCHYVAPDLHHQKEYFRNMYPIKEWVWPVNWFAACCCGRAGPWRTPRSGLTWFNINWIGIYHYCFVRVAMTVTAVVTHYFGRYCESSNSPVFSHIWVLAINCLAAAIAMYCIIQFYVQMKKPLDEHRPFLKVLAIKLVVFLSFWQITAVSIATSEKFRLLEPNSVVAYPDIKVGSPAAVLCIEMALFAVLHLWAFPYAPYVPGAKIVYYPSPDDRKDAPQEESVHLPPSGGFLGILAFLDAMNPWDFVKAFGRGMRWLFCGVRRRKDDPSYGNRQMSTLDLDDLAKPNSPHLKSVRSTEHLPIADEFRRSRFGISGIGMGMGMGMKQVSRADEDAGLIAHAQPSPTGTVTGKSVLSPSTASPYGRENAPSPLASQYPESSPYGAHSPYGNSALPMTPSLYGDATSSMTPNPYGRGIASPAPSPYPASSLYSAPSHGAHSSYIDAASPLGPAPYHDQSFGPYNRRAREREWEPSTPGHLPLDFQRPY